MHIRDRSECYGRNNYQQAVAGNTVRDAQFYVDHFRTPVQAEHGTASLRHPVDAAIAAYWASIADAIERNNP
jgi:hypothetical protein